MQRIERFCKTTRWFHWTFVLPFLGLAATGVTLEGMAYPLEDAVLEPADTLGFHNELTGREARVSVRDGALLVVHETTGP